MPAPPLQQTPYTDGVDHEGIVLRITSSTGFAVAGAIADVAAVAALAVQQDVRNWVSQNPLVLIAVAAVSILLALLATNAYSRERQRALSVAREQATEATELRRRVHELEARLREPAKADIVRWREFWTDFGRDSALYVWLKEHFYTSYALEHEVDELDRVCKKWKRDGAKFYDTDVESSFALLRTSLFKLKRATSNNYWYDDTPGASIGWRRLQFPPEWDYRRKEAATDEVNTAWDEVMEQYHAFLSMAQRKKLVGSERKERSSS
jgi:hypothetical protein